MEAGEVPVGARLLLTYGGSGDASVTRHPDDQSTWRSCPLSYAQRWRIEQQKLKALDLERVAIDVGSQVAIYSG
jgi:hypothetical protein